MSIYVTRFSQIEEKQQGMEKSRIFFYFFENSNHTKAGFYFLF
jgi:hypothetical protein